MADDAGREAAERARREAAERALAEANRLTREQNERQRLINALSNAGSRPNRIEALGAAQDYAAQQIDVRRREAEIDRVAAVRRFEEAVRAAGLERDVRPVRSSEAPREDPRGNQYRWDQDRQREQRDNQQAAEARDAQLRMSQYRVRDDISPQRAADFRANEIRSRETTDTTRNADLRTSEVRTRESVDAARDAERRSTELRVRPTDNDSARIDQIRRSEGDARLRVEQARNADNARIRPESIRPADDDSRVRAEQVRRAKDDTRLQVERARQTDTDARFQIEQMRRSENDARVQTEQVRRADDDARINAEQVRRADGDNRVRVDQVRRAEDDGRIRTEQIRRVDDDNRIRTDQIRRADEDNRIRTDQVRRADEDTRIRTDQIRRENDDNHIRTEQVRQSADGPVVGEKVVALEKGAPRGADPTTPKKQSQKAPDEGKRIEAEEEKQRIQQDIERQRAELFGSYAAAKTRRERLTKLRANPKQRPAEIDHEFDRLPRGLEERLEAIRALQTREGLSPDAIEYLKWQEELLDLQSDKEGQTVAMGKLADKQQADIIGHLPDAEAALREASKTLKDRLRKEGPNYAKKSAKGYDEILGDERFKALPLEQRELQTDHLVPLDWVANSREMTEFLKVFAAADEATKAKMTAELEAFGDVEGNLVRMRADANNFKKAEPWSAKLLQEWQRFGYTDQDVKNMINREERMLAKMKETILNVADKYRRNFQPISAPEPVADQKSRRSVRVKR